MLYNKYYYIHTINQIYMYYMYTYMNKDYDVFFDKWST